MEQSSSQKVGATFTRPNEFSAFYENEGQLPYLQTHGSGLYPQPNETKPQPPPPPQYFFKIHFNIKLPCTPRSSMRYHLFRLYRSKLCVFIIFPMHTTRRAHHILLKLLKTKRNESTSVSSAPRFPKEHCFLEGSQAAPVCRFGKRNTCMRRCMEHWWSDTDGKTKIFEESPVPVPLCPPQILYNIAWGRTQPNRLF
jgi:hypothetical protein